MPDPPEPLVPTGSAAGTETARRTPRNVRIARIVAIVADVLQLAFFPAFVGGWLSPLTLIVDVVAAFILVRLLGWHLAFLPSFIAEAIPGLDLIPTWTAAVFLATRGKRIARP